MLNKHIRRLFSVALMVLIGTTSALCDVATPTTHITQISHQYSTYTAYILTDQATPVNVSPNPCANAYPYLLADSSPGETYKAVMPLLMAAYLYNRNVVLLINGCSGGGTSGYPLITQVFLNS